MIKLLACTAVLLGVAAPAAAQTQPQQSRPAISFDDQPSASSDADSKRVICQREEKIGSRLQAKKVCLTAAQWKEREQRLRNDLDSMHTNTQNAGSPGG